MVQSPGTDDRRTLEQSLTRAPRRGDPVRAVQLDIDTGIAVYDELFDRQRAQHGTAFVEEYLAEVPTHMATHIVKAFEEHDRKRYRRCAASFSEVYTFLFPVRREQAYAGGTGYAQALQHHDMIEDGVDVVVQHEPVTDSYIDTDGEIPLKARDILAHPSWNAVLIAFELVSDALELPHQYAEEQTEFFRYHTAAHEAADRHHTVHRYLGPIALWHAKRAQKVKFGVFLDDEETLDRIAETYLNAVRSHDAHTEQDQWDNIERMTEVYETVLESAVDAGPQ